MDFVKDHKDLYNNTNELSRIKQGRSVSGSSSPTAASCLSRCARPGLTLKDILWESDTIKVSTNPEDARKSELYTGQVWIPEVVHQT